MSGTIELHAFMGLADVFRERQWTNPTFFPLDRETTGAELMAKLDIPMERVEVIFINRKAIAADDAVIQPGDRVALVPPGVPGPHRFLLGFKNRKAKAE
jgi:sulfur carrier protein ThiS